MKNFGYLTISLFFIVLIACSPTIMKITVNPQYDPSEFKSTTLPYKIGLLIEPSLENFHYTKHLTKELSDLDYNLGQATKTLFIDTFMKTSKGVILLNSLSTDELKDKEVDIIVKPQIISFEETHPPVLTIGTYTADITYKVSFYNKQGKLIFTKTYQGHGVAKGERTHNPGDNYAKPVESAMKNALKKILYDLKNMNI